MIGVDFADMDGNYPVDWLRLSTQIAFAGLRACEGTRLDATYRQADTARAFGVPVFGYLIINWRQPASAQAAAFASAIGRIHETDLPPAIDVEYSGDLGKIVGPSAAVAMVESIAREVRARLGRTPMIYTSNQQWTENLGDLDSPELGRLPLWLATPYTWRAGNPPHLDDPRIGKIDPVPRPWARAVGPGVRIQQFQGDARGAFGLRQCDLNAWRPLGLGSSGSDVVWLQRALSRLGCDPGPDDRVFGPNTGAALASLTTMDGTQPVLSPRAFATLMRRLDEADNFAH